MSDISLGSISALVKLNLTQLGVDVQAAKALMGELGGSMQASAGRLASSIGRDMTMAGAAITGALGLAVKVGADFQSTLTNVANNTTMTAADIKEMEATVTSMGRTSAAPLKELAEGFMHITNFGFQAKDAHVILNEAMKSAVSTGGNVGKTAELLAQVMHQYGMKTSEAARAMNVLHLAAAQGNMTLEQMVASGGKSITMARNVGVSFVDVAAAMSALTRNGFNAATASTQVTGMLTKIINPAAGASKELAKISQQTGIDLVRDFSAAGLQARTLPGVLDDIRIAAEKAHIPLADFTKLILPATRGGIGATALMGNARGDLNSIHSSLQGAKDGKSQATNEDYARSQKTLNNQLGVFRNNLTLLASDIEKTLLPVLTPMLAWVKEAVQWFGNLPQPVKEVGVVLAAIAGVVLTIAGPIVSLVGAFASLSAVATAAGTSLGAMAAAAAPIVAWVAVIAAAVAALVIAWQQDWGHIREHTQAFIAWIKPYLEEAWNGIKSAAMAVWGAISDFMQRIWPPVRDVIIFTWNEVSGFLRSAFAVLQALFSGTWNNIVGVLQGAWNVIKGVVQVAWGVIAGIITVGLDLLTGRWHKAWEDIQHYVGIVWDGIKNIFSGALKAVVNVVEGGAKLLWNAGKHLVEGLIDGIKSMISGVVDAASNLANSAVDTVESVLDMHSPSRVMKKLGQNTAQGYIDGIRDKVKEVRDAIYEMTHTDFAAQRRDAWQDMQQQLKDGVPFQDANKLYGLKRNKIDAAQAKDSEQRGDRMKDAMAQISALSDGVEQTWAKIGTLWKGNAGPAIAKMSEGLSAMWNAMGGELNKALADEKALQEERIAFEYRTGQMSLDQYRNELLEKLKAYQEYSKEWMKIKEEIFALDKQDAAKYSKSGETATKSMGDSARGQKNYLRGAMQDLGDTALDTVGKTLHKGLKGTFGNLLTNTLMDVLKDVLQNAIASIFKKGGGAGGGGAGGMGGILSGLGGLIPGGGIVGSLLGAFGFDDGANDRTAQRWGFDFADHFTRGMGTWMTQRQPAFAGAGAQAGGGNGDVHVHLNGPMTIHHPMDIDTLVDQIGQKTKQQLRVKVGKGP